jgi:hypothetical protein
MWVWNLQPVTAMPCEWKYGHTSVFPSDTFLSSSRMRSWTEIYVRNILMSYVLFFLHSCYISTYIANFKYLSLIWKAQVCEKENSELHEMLSVQQTGVKRGGL